MSASLVLDLIIDLLADYVPWVVLAFARPFGFTLLFAVFAWAKLSSGILRAAFALGISIPLLTNSIPSYGIEGLALPYLGTLIKEIFIGSILGLASSIPLAIAVSGGGIIDFYRGSFQGGPDPSGGIATPYANLFAVVSIWLFASMGGFMIITQTIYSSYEIWSVRAALPQFNVGADVLLTVMEKILLGGLVLSGPLLIIMFFSDIVHLISSKFGKKINVTHMAFSTKNLLAAAILPLFLVTAIRLFKSELEFLYSVNGFVQGIFQ